MNKLLIVLPPGSTEMTMARWSNILRGLAGTGLHNDLVGTDTADVLALFFSDGNTTFVVSRRKRQSDYEAALMLSLYGMLCQPKTFPASHEQAMSGPVAQRAKITMDRRQASCVILCGRALTVSGVVASVIWFFSLFPSSPF